jgi:transcriptional regulator with GAF, ATPase, and Fis domain
MSKVNETQPVETTNGSLSLEDIERQHFITVLKQTRGVIEGPNGAARLLNLKPSTARFRIKKLGIKKQQYEE